MKFSRFILVCAAAASAFGPALAQDDALRKQHDFMVNNPPLKAVELEAAFRGVTHDGVYRFEREEFPTHKFSESTSSDGKVKHVQGEEILTGKWSIQNDQICFIYDEVWPRELCFDIYRKGNCYYHYIMTEAGRPIRAWTARSTPKGERPSCEPNIS